uniref:Uncharacterized protein n=1 Tax=Globisporangium ultimum (strain ATCC 200006 / CBS 805.95 / DAOM BR144) TaxID=431595 RepID=K3WHW3_GLOUD
MSMWKQLFSEAPPGAVENLLSPKRKFWYAMFALTPGTLLALYLHRVKVEMEAEDEMLRLQHIQDELRGEADREQKDVALMGMIQEMRTRIASLEQQVTEAKATAHTQSSNKESAAASPDNVETQAPTSTADWEQQKALFLAPAPQSGAKNDAQSGINERVKQRERELLQHDVKEFKAARAGAGNEK